MINFSLKNVAKNLCINLPLTLKLAFVILNLNLNLNIITKENEVSTISIQPNEDNLFTPINNTFIDEHMAGAHGDYIKVYIYLLRLFSSRDTQFETGELSKKLDITESDVLKAIKYWAKKGLITACIEGDELKSIGIVQSATPKQVTQTKNTDCTIVPFKKSYDVTLFDRYSEDPDFILFTNIVGKYFAKTLNVNDINILINLLEKYQIHYDVLEFLVEQLADSGIKSVKSLESKCLMLAERGLHSLDEVKAFSRDNQVAYKNILRTLSPNLSSYHVDEDAIFLMDKWLYDYGFSYDMVYFAAEKTNKFLKSKELGHKINYCNKILENWYHKGIKTLEQARIVEDINKKRKTNTKKTNFSFDEHNYDFGAIEAKGLQDLEERVKNL